MILPINIAIEMQEQRKPKNKIWYTSDWHLNHAKIAVRRDYETVEKMHEEMLATVNACVGPDDTLYHLGDFCMYNKANAEVARKFLRQVNCKNIYAIQGNHDPKKFLEELHSKHLITAWRVSKCVDDIAFGRIMAVAMFHHPVLDYHSERMPEMCIHGHSHGCCKREPLDLQDVGWDVFHKPVTLEQILQYKFPNSENPMQAYQEALQKIWQTY